MASRNRRQSDKSNNSKLDDSVKSTGYAAGLTEMEYFWSIELNADKRTHIWMNNDDMEDGDEDFIEYTVFIKSATLGENAVQGEHNLVMLESAGSDGERQKGCIVHLSYGQNNMTPLDITVSSKMGPTTFTLAQGSGPVYICGNQLMEFPKEDSLLENSQTESEEEETEEEEEEEDLEEIENGKDHETDPKKAIKRKAAAPVNGKIKQKAKVDKEKDEEEEIDDEDEEDDEEEEEEMESEEEEEESEEEVKVKKTKKGKDVGKKAPKAKTVVSQKPVKKGKK